MAAPSFNITGYLTVIDLCDTGILLCLRGRATSQTKRKGCLWKTHCEQEDADRLGTLLFRHRPTDVLTQCPSECFPGIQHGSNDRPELGRAGCHVLYGNSDARHPFPLQTGCKDQT